MCVYTHFNLCLRGVEEGVRYQKRQKCPENAAKMSGEQVVPTPLPHPLCSTSPINMAHIYTTSRGKNKKGELWVRRVYQNKASSRLLHHHTTFCTPIPDPSPYAGGLHTNSDLFPLTFHPSQPILLDLAEQARPRINPRTAATTVPQRSNRTWPANPFWMAWTPLSPCSQSRACPLPPTV